MIGGKNPLARVMREIRLTLFPMEWSSKYPKIYIIRWIAVGSVVAALTGNLPVNRLNPFGKGGRVGAQEQLGSTITSIVLYPLPLTISITRWLGNEANHVCKVVAVSCDINPSRNLHFKIRSPVVKNPTPKAAPALAPVRGTVTARAP
jgi:hypothetical protein